MKAVILAAGAGTRLGPLTVDAPKCLLPINGRNLLDHELDALAAVGISDVTVVAGYMADRVVKHVGGRCRVIRNDDGLRPFLLWGSLLGCVRDGRFIAGDHDIDLGIFEGDADRLAALRSAMVHCGYGVRIDHDLGLRRRPR